MAGHATKHPYLKTYDEVKRSMNRMQVYLDMHSSIIPKEEKEEIKELISLLEEAIFIIPGKYQVSRYHQFKSNE